MPIVVEHFRRTYGTITAVDDLSFEVSAGEIVGLIGPNGAGKTTTLRSLAGILLPTSGRIRVDGFDLVTEPIDAKRRLAFMPDEPHLFEYLTVEEHLRLVGRLYGVDDFDRRAAALIGELELKGRSDRFPLSSRGMRQKVVIACGLVGRPRCCCSTSRSPDSIRLASGGCVKRSSREARPARRFWCPHIFCISSRKSAPA